MIRMHDQRPARGFSLVELMIVVAIVLVVGAIAIPGAVTAQQNFKLRSTASSLSGIVQKARMVSVSRNRSFPMLTSGSGTGQFAFIDMDGSGTMNTTAENTSVLMPVNVTFTTGGHPDDSTILGGLIAVYQLPMFNPRGLPCFPDAGVCKANPGQMYITFLRQDRPLGGTGWAAVNVLPAGRVQVWTWDGEKWE